MRFVSLCFLLSLSAFASVKYESNLVWGDSGLKMLKITYEGDSNMFIPPTKLKKEVKGFYYDFELSRRIMELRLLQLNNRLQTLKNLGTDKAHKYLQEVFNFPLSTSLDKQIYEMHKQRDQLNSLVKNLNFYSKQFLLSKDATVILYYTVN